MIVSIELLSTFLSKIRASKTQMLASLQLSNSAFEIPQKSYQMAIKYEASSKVRRWPLAEMQHIQKHIVSMRDAAHNGKSIM